MKQAIWTVKEIVEILKARQKNEFDGNIACSGDRGNGKSTLLNKIYYRFGVFEPWKHQVYSRGDVIKLLKTQRYGLCWDDEAINSGYKRDFQNKGQQELIKILTAYRDNFNIFSSAVPNFFSLDKDLRDLYFIHFHVIERGIAVVHMPIQGRLYSQDRWDAKFNAKIEESWSKRLQKDSNFKPPYHKLTTFRGYLYFNKLTEIQEKIYKQVKRTKRAESFGTEEEKKASREVTFMERLYNQLIGKKLTKEGLIQICLMENKKYSSINASLNRMLTDNGIDDTVKDYLQQTNKKPFHNNPGVDINSIVPNI